MSNGGALPLRIVDGLDLDDERRALLRPGETMPDRDGRMRRLPRFFYEVPSWSVARGIQLSRNFALWEFLDVDVREAEPLRVFPRYVPCALPVLASHLELFRREAGGIVHIAANGGYRSPAHRYSDCASPHIWGTAVNIYKIGDDFLDTRERIEKFNRMARELLPALWARPYGEERNKVDDHVHLDIGYAVVVPHTAPSERPLAGVGTDAAAEAA